jgi:hypothetical protein
MIIGIGIGIVTVTVTIILIATQIDHETPLLVSP